MKEMIEKVIRFGFLFGFFIGALVVFVQHIKEC